MGVEITASEPKRLLGNSVDIGGSRLLLQDFRNLAERVAFVEWSLRPLKQVGEQSGDRIRCSRNPFFGEVLKHLRMGDKARGVLCGQGDTVLY